MTRPAQHPASNSEARKRHDAPTCLACGNSVPVDASALAAAKAEGRIEQADRIRKMATDRFAVYGPYDARGAALWDVAAWLVEDYDVDGAA